MFFYEKHRFGDEVPYEAYTLENTSFPYHFHRSFEFICAVGGCLELLADGRSYLLSEGTAALIFPNQLHAFSPKGSARITIVIFSPDLVGDFSAHCQGRLPDTNCFPFPPVEAKELQFSNLYLRKSFLYRICGCLCGHTDFSPREAAGRGMPLLHRILSYMEEHLEEDCSLKGAAHALGYDYTYLSRFFLGQMGISFTAFLNQYRISRACHLLADTSESVSFVAMKCGYGSLRTFNRNFRRLTGRTPLEYRRRFE